eukprot:maker-scaffold104_size368486-snap-gene-2.39 protein:Tk07559 transcript:maker-scaffold104_size368486-snap-gene-2.39-mRNA-1 annotation:"virulence factor"
MDWLAQYIQNISGLTIWTLEIHINRGVLLLLNLISECRGQINCPAIPKTSDECLCQESSNCQMIPEDCFKTESQNANCPEIREDCLENDARIRTIDENLHNATFRTNMRNCLLEKDFTNLNDVCDALGKDIKVAMPLVINNVTLGKNGCILNAGDKILCLMKIHERGFYCALIEEFKFK